MNAINFSDLYERYLKMEDANDSEVTIAIIAHIGEDERGNDLVGAVMDQIKSTLVSIYTYRDRSLQLKLSYEVLFNNFVGHKSSLPKFTHKLKVMVVISGVDNVYDKKYFYSRIKRFNKCYENIKFIEFGSLLTCSEARQLAVNNCDTTLIQFIDKGDHIEVMELCKLLDNIENHKTGFLYTCPLFAYEAFITNVAERYLMGGELKINPSALQHRFTDPDEVELFEKYVDEVHDNIAVYDMEHINNAKYSTIQYKKKSKSRNTAFGKIDSTEVNSFLTTQDYVNNKPTKYVEIISARLYKRNNADYAVTYPCLVQTPWNVNLLKLVYEIIEKNQWHVNFKEDTLAHSIARKILEVGGIDCKLWYKPYYYYTYNYRSITHIVDGEYKIHSDKLKESYLMDSENVDKILSNLLNLKISNLNQLNLD